MSEPATPAEKLYVARESDLEQLRQHWSAARAGSPRLIRMSAPLGGGKRALTGELCRAAQAEEEDVIVWRVAMHDEEDGLQSLIRIYAGLFGALHRAPILRGKIEMALSSQLPSQPKRVQGWYQAFIEGLKKGAPKAGASDFQVVLPRDNPLIGLVEILTGIARKFPVILELQNVHHVQSLAIHSLLESLIHETSGDGTCHLLAIIGHEPVDETSSAWFSRPLLDLFERSADTLPTFTLTPWDATDTSRYLESKSFDTANAADITRIASGRPGFVAEVADWLSEQERLTADISALELKDIVDLKPDADELEAPEEGEAEGGRTHAGADDAERVAFLAALLGLSFPSGLVADMGGFERESIDDLLDATEQTYKELQFAKQMGTWIYQFHKALLRESILARNATDEGRDLARRVGLFLERFLVPRGYPFLVKTMRIFAESGAPDRANLLRSVALGSDQPQVWAMIQDLLRYFDDVEWPAAMRRTVYMNLVERMVQQGDVNQADNLYNQAMEWATKVEDRNLQAWLLFAGSRLDFRRQDLYRARDRANDALKMLSALGDKLKSGEVHTHLAMIELQDGNKNAALDQARLAEEVAPVPPMQAHAEYVRGLVSKSSKKWPEAINHFQAANELAGKNGVAQLALEAGLNLGECLLASGQHSKAADVLQRVGQIAAQLNNGVRLRTATALLAQAHAALKNFEAAIQAATQTLELTRQLKFERLEPIDLYNVGFFNMMLGRNTEAVSLFRQAKEKMDATDANFQKELLFSYGSALATIGERSQATEMLRASVNVSTQVKDWRKVSAAWSRIADLDQAKGDPGSAKLNLEKAVDAAEKAGMKEEIKDLRKKIRELGR